MNTKPRQSARYWIAATLLATPALYVLSVGPMMRWCQDLDDSNPALKVLEIVYAPISLAMDTPVIGVPLELYCEWWMEPSYEWTTPVSAPAPVPSGTAGTATRVVPASAVERALESAEEKGEIEESETEVTPAHAVTAGPPPSVRRSYEVTVPPVGSRPTDVPPVLIAEGDRQQLAMQVDGANPKLTANLLYLSGNVRISTPDARIVIASESASISHRFVEGSRTEIRDVGVEFMGKVQWKGAGLEATAHRLYLTLVPPGPDEDALPGISKLELWGPVQITASATIGKADSAEFEFDPKTGLSADLPVRIVLKGNAKLSLPGMSGAKGTFEAARIDYFPRTDKVNVERVTDP